MFVGQVKMLKKIREKYVYKANAETNVRTGLLENKVYLLTTNRACFI